VRHEGVRRGACAVYEAKSEEQSFLRAVVQGLMDIEEGQEISLAEAIGCIDLVTQ